MCEKLHKALITEEIVKDLEEIRAEAVKARLTKPLPVIDKTIAKWRKRRTI